MSCIHQSSGCQEPFDTSSNIGAGNSLELMQYTDGEQPDFFSTDSLTPPSLKRATMDASKVNAGFRRSHPFTSTMLHWVLTAGLSSGVSPKAQETTFIL